MISRVARRSRTPTRSLPWRTAIAVGRASLRRVLQVHGTSVLASRFVGRSAFGAAMSSLVTSILVTHHDRSSWLWEQGCAQGLSAYPDTMQRIELGLLAARFIRGKSCALTVSR